MREFKYLTVIKLLTSILFIRGGGNNPRFGFTLFNIINFILNKQSNLNKFFYLKRYFECSHFKFKLFLIIFCFVSNFFEYGRYLN